MKIHASFSRKVGLPGYCSVGAECSVEIDLPKTADGDKIHEQVIAAFSIATAAVEEQLRAQIDLATAPTAEPEPEPEPEPDPEPRRDGHRLPRSNGYTGPRLDHPQDGRQLLAVLRKMEDAPDASGVPDMNELVRWGKNQGFGWKVVEWGDAQAAAAYEWLLAQQEERNRPVPEPGPVRAGDWRRAGTATTGRRVVR